MKIKMNFAMLRDNASGLVDIVETQICYLLNKPFPAKGDLMTEEYLGTYESLLVSAESNFIRLHLKWNEFNCQLPADIPKEFWENGLDDTKRKDIRFMVERMVNYWLVRYSITMLLKIFNNTPQLSKIVDDGSWILLNEFYSGFYIETKAGGYVYKCLFPNGDLLRSQQVDHAHYSRQLPNFSRGFIDFSLGNGKLRDLVIGPSGGKPDMHPSFNHDIFDHVLEDLAVLGLHGYLTHDVFNKRITL